VATVTRVLVGIAGVISGIAWWAISLALGANAFGILGAYPLTGVVSAVCTGLAVTALSIPVYRRVSPRGLLWFSPLSVYVAIAIYGLVVFVIRSLLNDYHPNQIRWADGLQSVTGMWWGITFLLPFAIPVQLLAYANHWLLRSITLASSRPRTSERSRAAS
jgi:hypothetical protein